MACGRTDEANFEIIKRTVNDIVLIYIQAGWGCSFKLLPFLGRCQTKYNP